MRGAEVDPKDQWESTPLADVIFYKNHKLLEKNGAEPLVAPMHVKNNRATPEDEIDSKELGFSKQTDAGRMAQLVLSGDVSDVLDVNMQHSTLGHVRHEAALRMSVDQEDVNLIHRGRVLKCTDDSRKLHELDIMHKSKIVAIKVYTEGTVLDQIKRAASAFYKNHKECSMPVENVFIEIEDADERVVYHSETDRRNVMTGLVLNKKARRLLKENKLEEALGVLKLATPEDCSVCRGDPSNKSCLKCGKVGHLMFFCPNDYNFEDLEEPVLSRMGEISCSKCEKPGHEICGHEPGPVALSSCYKCGEVGHWGEICPKPPKVAVAVKDKRVPITVCAVTIDLEKLQVDLPRSYFQNYRQLKSYLTELVLGPIQDEKIYATFTVGDREDEDEQLLCTIPFEDFHPSVIYVMPASFRDIRLWKAFTGMERFSAHVTATSVQKNHTC